MPPRRLVVPAAVDEKVEVQLPLHGAFLPLLGSCRINLRFAFQAVARPKYPTLIRLQTATGSRSAEGDLVPVAILVKRSGGLECGHFDAVH